MSANSAKPNIVPYDFDNDPTGQIVVVWADGVWCLEPASLAKVALEWRDVVAVIPANRLLVAIEEDMARDGKRR